MEEGESCTGAARGTQDKTGSASASPQDSVPDLIEHSRRPRDAPPRRRQPLRKPLQFIGDGLERLEPLYLCRGGER